jgi:hypothetical protein
MDVVSLCAFRTAQVLWQQRQGTWVQTVICKGTFELAPGEARLAEDQEDPNEHDNYWNDDPARSLYSPSDLVPFKPRCDVMLVGHAFAPNGETVKSLVARMHVGEINKAVEVHGERAWTPQRALREGAGFVKMPLRYERASGGPLTWNPVGMKSDGKPDTQGNLPLPNLQAPRTFPHAPGDFIEPAGFGPIAPTWPHRRLKLGRHEARFTSRDLASEPLPPDMDHGFWNSAPRDQQPGVIRSNERILLEHLHPTHARLVTALPGFYPRAFVDKGLGGTPQELPLTCDTLWIDTDRAICTLTWRGCLPIEGPTQTGRILIAMERPGQRLAWADVERLASGASDEPAAQGDDSVVEIEDPESANGDDEEDSTCATQLPPSFRRRPAAGTRATPMELGDSPLETLPLPMNLTKMGLLPPRPGQRTPHDTMPDSSLQRQQEAARPLVSSAMPFVQSPEGAPKTTPPPSQSPENDGPRIRFGAPPPPPPPPPGDAAPAWLAQPRVTTSSAPLPPAGAGNPHSAVIPLPTVGAPSGLGGPTPIPPAPPTAPPGSPRHAPISPQAAFNTTELGHTTTPTPLPAPPPPGPAPAAVSAGTSESPWTSAAPAPSPMGSDLGSTTAVSAPASPSAATSGPGAAPAGLQALKPASLGPIAPPPPANAHIPIPGAVATAALGGAVAASNAAAATTRTEAPAASPVILPRPYGGVPAREACHLLWYEREAISTIRAVPEWKAIIEALDEGKEPVFFDFDDEPPPEPPPEVQERRDIVAVLTRGTATDAEALQTLLVEAIQDDGSFAPPLVLMSGEVFFPFDEVETLKATVTAVTPLMAGDKKLKETVDTANELLKTPWIHGSSGVAEGMTQKVREAFAQAPRMLPAGYLDTHTQRILLEQRHYQKRSVFGEESIRGELLPAGSQIPIPVYLLSALSKKLPMFQRLKVKMIAEGHVQQDQFEAHPSALRVIALGRSIALGGRGHPGGR